MSHKISLYKIEVNIENNILYDFLVGKKSLKKQCKENTLMKLLLNLTSSN